MMAYQETRQIEITCDFPMCEEWLLFGPEGWDKIEKMIYAIGWTHISFPSEDKTERLKYLTFCSDCKKKELPLDSGVNKNHHCVFMRTTKTGKPSEYGTVLTCYYCGITRFDKREDSK